MTGTPPLPASLFGVTAALDGPYVTALNTIAGTGNAMGGVTGSADSANGDGTGSISSAVDDDPFNILDDGARMKALNAAAEAARQDRGE